jgi:hypothetical protein
VTLSESAVAPEEKLGTAAEYLAAQVAEKKANGIVSVYGARVAQRAGALRPVLRSLVHKAAAAAGRRPTGKAGETSVEDRQ